MEELLARGAAPAADQATNVLLSAPEAQRIVERLRPFEIEEYGSPEFLEHHDWVVALNLQAHANAAARGDEFVVEALVSHDKIGALVANLLVAEAWREHAFPLLRAHLARAVDGVGAWSMLHHETALANLLEVALYHRHAAEAAGEDALLELADWAYRKLAHLNSDAHAYAAATMRNTERTAEQLLAQSPEEELAERAAEAEWGAALCGLTVARYLAEHAPALPLGVTARLVSSNDTVMALLPLVDRPPWARVAKGGRLERYDGGRWRAVAPADRAKLTQADAQVWLALHALLLDPACRAKYDPDEYRRDALQRLRRFLTDALLDQLPVLRALQRLLDELAVGGGGGSGGGAAPPARVFCDRPPPGSSDVGGSGSGDGAAAARPRAARLILEQVPLLRERLLRGRDWRATADTIRARWLGAGAAQLARERAERMMASFEFMCGMEEEEKGQQQQQQQQQQHNAGSSDGSPAPLRVKVECWRRVRAGVHERWCEFECGVVDDAARGAPEAVVVKGEGGAAARGLRYRLAAGDLASTRALPCDGKIVVRCGERRAEAQLKLPSVALRSLQDDTPPGLWLTVGLLATDGIALQLRLKRAPKPVDRDAVAGVWYAYCAVGGAVTLRRDEREVEGKEPAGRGDDGDVTAGRDGGGGGGSGGGGCDLGALD